MAKKLGWDFAELKHIKYGLVLGERGKKFLRAKVRRRCWKLLDESVVKAREVIEKKIPTLTPKRKNGDRVRGGNGSVKYNDLKENRTTDIIFNWEKMLDFSGDSAPYLQYTYARLKSILRKSNISESKLRSKSVDATTLARTAELALMRKLFEFPDIVERAGELYSTSTLASIFTNSQ